MPLLPLTISVWRRRRGVCCLVVLSLRECAPSVERESSIVRALFILALLVRGLPSLASLVLLIPRS